MDFCPDEATFAALINAYARKGKIEKAKTWLDKMQENVTQARIQSYNFDLVFQACGQISTKDDVESNLRLEAPVFQPCSQTKTALPVETPVFEFGIKQNHLQKTELCSEAPKMQTCKLEQNMWNRSNRFWGRSTEATKIREDSHSYSSWSHKNTILENTE